MQPHRNRLLIRFVANYRSVLLFAALFAIVLFVYLFADTAGDRWPRKPIANHRIDLSSRDNYSFEDMLSMQRQFSVSGKDVMVFLHVQKTGGTTFGKHLVNDLWLEQRCDCRTVPKRCHCFRPGTRESWLFSRYSTGWKCGLHADWTELNECVSEFYVSQYKTQLKWQYFYVTIVREPIKRFLSEYLHVKRGATWRTAEHKCNGRVPTEDELPSCYAGDFWNVGDLGEFMACESNLAINRQTRMLADLHLVACYNRTAFKSRDRDRIMLQSAKRNLEQMAFFALVEEQQKSQFMFERVFGLKFRRRFEPYDDRETNAARVMPFMPTAQLKRARHLNYLDVELYAFARDLFFARFERLRADYESFVARKPTSADETVEETADD